MTISPDLVCLAPAHLENVFREEVQDRIISERGRLFLLSRKTGPFFSQNIWLNPKIFTFSSISKAANQLRAIQRNWWLHSTGHHRRAQLIQEQLPPLKPKPLSFDARMVDQNHSVPKAPLGSWTLLDESTLLYSSECTSAFADGELIFHENRTDPPSRAYLKLWEFFTLTGRRPQPGDRVLDLGSSPGGWTWVLDQLSCEVISVDKAPLSVSTTFSERVKYRQESAFALNPNEIGKVDWVFSDVICYPERLLDLIKRWQPFSQNFVCSIKFQGETNFEVLNEFRRLPNSEIRHLFHNKHELTFSQLV